MARRRFFVPRIQDGLAELTGEDARHLSRVLRAEAGQQYEISDGESLYLAEIREVARDRIGFRILEPLEAAAPAGSVTLVAALIKFDRFEWMIEKATELGVDTIIPVAAERSEKGLLEGARKRLERWRRIVFESGQQSRRLRPPEVCEPERLATVLARCSGSLYYLEEKAAAVPFVTALAQCPAEDRATLLVGPEGGWTDAERERFIAGRWMPVSLGPHILRAETAAVAGVSVWISTRHAGEYR